jgi:hypothetical protein
MSAVSVGVLNPGKDDVDQQLKTDAIVSALTRRITGSHYEVQHILGGHIFTYTTRIDGTLTKHLDTSHKFIEHVSEARFDVYARLAQGVEEIVLLRGLVSELTQEGAQSFLHVGVRRALVGGLDKTSEARDDDFFEERFLRGKVAVQGPDSDPRSLGDYVDRDHYTIKGKDFFSRSENLLVISCRIGAHCAWFNIERFC